MVHIEELFAAFQTFNQKAIACRNESIRNPKEWEQKMCEARDEFKAFCQKHNLPVDFTARD